jgi:hypothetical protein
MKKTKNRTKKLKLSRETIRALQSTDIQKVAGGFSDMLGGTSCTPACNVDESNPCQ